MTQKIKILIIDDEQIVLSSCRKIFRNSDYIIDTASSGEEGIRLVMSGSYHIVVTDLMMPGMSGMEVLDRIVNDKPSIKVIIFTGYATIESVRGALKAGAFDYIPKPFTPEEMRNVIDNAIKSLDSGKEAKMLDLLAIVSHELKSPLSVVQTTADTLYRGYFGKLDPEQQKTMEAILRNCQYLEDIIRNYLDFTKMEMDDIDSIKSTVNFINDVVMPVIEIPENKENMKKMNIETDFQIKPVIHGDSNLLRIVITNLVNNAIKYGQPSTPIRMSLSEAEGEYIYSITNTGVGISEKDMPMLFKKFSRLKQKGTEGIKGSGLGLYMCKNIIERHGGRIWVKSDTGRETTFYVSLPRD
jgi:signal transduction histidine kinase